MRAVVTLWSVRHQVARPERVLYLNCEFVLGFAVGAIHAGTWRGC